MGPVVDKIERIEGRDDSPPFSEVRCGRRAVVQRWLRGAGTSTDLRFIGIARCDQCRDRAHVSRCVRGRCPLGGKHTVTVGEEGGCGSMHRELRFQRAFRGRQTGWGYLCASTAVTDRASGYPAESGPPWPCEPEFAFCSTFPAEVKPAHLRVRVLGGCAQGNISRCSRIAGQRSREFPDPQLNEYRRLLVQLSVPCPRAWRRRWSRT